jgi:hypothetical protein
MDKVGPALIGKAGEYLVAGELLDRRPTAVHEVGTGDGPSRHRQ